jgi:hypothetical protein
VSKNKIQKLEKEAALGSPRATRRERKIVSDQTIHVPPCEISSSHGGEYDVQSCLLGCTAV